MKLLILGASDSEGSLLPNFADSWRERLRLGLPALIGEDVDVVHRRFYVHVPGVDGYVDRVLTEDQPDFVIVGATGYAFTTSSVGNRLRRLLGQRAGTWFERKSAGFDRATEKAEGTAAERMNYSVHWIAGKLIGRDSLSTYDEVFAAYRRTLDRLARDERLDAVVLGTTYNGPRVQRRLPHLRMQADRFNAEMRSLAESRRFGWLDRQAIISALPAATARPDQMHTGAEIHAAYADALLPLVATRVGARVR